MARINWVILICIFENFACLGSAQQFLNSLKNQTSSSATGQQLSQSQQEQAEESQDAQELAFIQNFYGNPKYQDALAILNNESLQEQYQQALNNYQLQFFEYTNQVLSGYHTPQNAAKKTGSATTSVTLSSFLNSLKNQNSQSVAPSNTQIQSSTQQASVASNESDSTGNSATSFLNSLKG